MHGNIQPIGPAGDDAFRAGQLRPAGQSELSIRQGQAAGGAPVILGSQILNGDPVPLDDIKNPAKEILSQIRADPQSFPGFDPTWTDAQLLEKIGNVKAEVAIDHNGKHRVDTYMVTSGTPPDVTREVRLRAVMKYSFTFQADPQNAAVTGELNTWRYTSEPEISSSAEELAKLTDPAGDAGVLREARLSHMERMLAALEVDARSFEAGMAGAADPAGTARRTAFVAKDTLAGAIDFDSKSTDNVILAKHSYSVATAELPAVSMRIDSIARESIATDLLTRKAQREEGAEEKDLAPTRVSYVNPDVASVSSELRELAVAIVDGQNLGTGPSADSQQWIDDRVAELQTALVDDNKWDHMKSHLQSQISSTERLDDLTQKDVVRTYQQLKAHENPARVPNADGLDGHRLKALQLSLAGQLATPKADADLKEYLRISEGARERLDSPNMNAAREALQHIQGEGPLVQAVLTALPEAKVARERLAELNTDGKMDTAIQRLRSCPTMKADGSAVIPDEIDAEMLALEGMKQDIIDEQVHELGGADKTIAHAGLGNELNIDLSAAYSTEVNAAAISDTAKAALLQGDPTALRQAELDPNQADGHLSADFKQACADRYLADVQAAGLDQIETDSLLRRTDGTLGGDFTWDDMQARADNPASQAYRQAAFVRVVTGDDQATGDDAAFKAAKLNMSPNAYSLRAMAEARGFPDPARKSDLVASALNMQGPERDDASRTNITNRLHGHMMAADPYNDPNQYNPQEQQAVQELWRNTPQLQEIWEGEAVPAAKLALNGVQDPFINADVTQAALTTAVGAVTADSMSKLTGAIGDDNLIDYHANHPETYTQLFEQTVGTVEVPAQRYETALALQLLADAENYDGGELRELLEQDLSRVEGMDQTYVRMVQQTQWAYEELASAVAADVWTEQVDPDPANARNGDVLIFNSTFRNGLMDALRAGEVLTQLPNRMQD